RICSLASRRHPYPRSCPTRRSSDLIDVSTIKELSRRWYPRAYYAAPEKTGGHRALGDIRDSITELRYYRQAVFLPPPGLDTAALDRKSTRLNSSHVKTSYAVFCCTT